MYNDCQNEEHIGPELDMDDLIDHITNGLLAQGVVVERSTIDNILEMEVDFLQGIDPTVGYSIDDVAQDIVGRLKGEHNIEVDLADIVRVLQHEDVYLLENGFMSPSDDDGGCQCESCTGHGCD